MTEEEIASSGYAAGKQLPIPVVYGPRFNFSFTFTDTTGLFLSTGDGATAAPLEIDMFMEGYSVPVTQLGQFCPTSRPSGQSCNRLRLQTDDSEPYNRRVPHTRISTFGKALSNHPPGHRGDAGSPGAGFGSDPIPGGLIFLPNGVCRFDQLRQLFPELPDRRGRGDRGRPDPEQLFRPRYPE